MSELESALDRLGEAVAGLIATSDQGRAARGAEVATTARAPRLPVEPVALPAEAVAGVAVAIPPTAVAAQVALEPTVKSGCGSSKRWLRPSSNRG